MGNIYAKYKRDLDAKRQMAAEEQVIITDEEYAVQTDDMVRYEKFIVINSAVDKQYVATKAPNIHGTGLPTKVNDSLVQGTAFKVVEDALNSLNGAGNMATVRIVAADSGKSVVVRSGNKASAKTIIDALADKQNGQRPAFIRVAWPMDRDYGKGVHKDTLTQIGGIGAWEVILDTNNMELYGHTHGYAAPGKTEVQTFADKKSVREFIANRGSKPAMSSDDVPSLR
ncbi:MAG: hypothetical protein J6V40_03760 [Clostridia bacterium]|nr:hypothetical protein [Clostridia bacterium]